MRRVHVVVVCCCLLSGAVFAVPTTGQTGPAPNATTVTTPTTNTTAYLTIPSAALETAGYRRTTLGVTGALALDTRGLEGEFDRLALDKRFDTTDSTKARRARLRATASRLEARIDRLRERQSAAVHAYNNHTLSERGFALELARIHVAAGEVETAAGRVEDRATSVPRSFIDGQPARNWASNRRVELGPLQGPVRDRIAGAFRGENTIQVDEAAPAGLKKIGSTSSERVEPLQVYVETAGQGVVLATTDDGTYYREAYLPGERNATGGGLGGIRDALGRMAERYPWTWNHSTSSSATGDRHAGVYRFALFHSHGRLTTYLDRSSGGVFAEHQRKSLMNVPTTATVTRETRNLRLRVNRTHPTGPLELALSTTDGEPVDGRITIDNRSVGRTGSDGRLWTVSPRGTITVVARTNDGTVRVTTNATPQSNRTVADLGAFSPSEA